MYSSLKNRFRALCSILLLALPVSLSAQDVTYENLLDRLSEREEVARYPSPAFKLHQASSYNRASTNPDDLTVENWFANKDWDYYVGTETIGGRTELVLMDAAGPGALVRFWVAARSPAEENLTLRVYLDGDLDNPVIESPIRDLMDGSGPVASPLSADLCAPDPRKGYNLYLPIPYAHSCKVTYEDDNKSERLFYNINYMTFAPGTTVESYTPAIFAANQAKLDAANAALSAGPDSSVGATTPHTLDGAIAPGGHLALPLAGAGSIRRMSFRLAADDLGQALRSTVVEITFDGTRTAWCPIGEFFGTGYKISPYQSWYTEVEADGTMTCVWVMPYQTSAEVKLVNYGFQDVTVASGVVETAPWTWDERSMYFHADWQEYNRIANRPFQDVNYVTVTGKGVCVGDSLTLFNGTSKWWGEGDEKIFIDDEYFPSMFGTGTEDYYGYAFGQPDTFSHPFVAQPRGDSNYNPARGTTINNRYRVLDGMPFNTKLELNMELWTADSGSGKRLNMSPATYWYGRPGAVSDITPNPGDVRYAVVRSVAELNALPQYPPGAPVGRGEAENTTVSFNDGGAADPQYNTQRDWSNDAILFWDNDIDDDGSRLTVVFDGGSGGIHELELKMIKAADYGILSISLNGRTIVPDFDGYNDGVASHILLLGQQTLLPGNNNVLSFLVTGRNAASTGYKAGVDYLDFERVGDGPDNVIADAAADYTETAPPAGWAYLRSDAASGGTETALNFVAALPGGGGMTANPGYTGNATRTGRPLPVIVGSVADTLDYEIFGDGDLNGGVLGTDLLFHPGDNTDNYGDGFVIARYTVSAAHIAAHGTLATVGGSFRNLIPGGHDSVEVVVYHNDSLLFSALGTDADLLQATGTFTGVAALTAFTVAANDTISFVVGGRESIAADETALFARISLAPESIALQCTGIGFNGDAVDLTFTTNAASLTHSLERSDDLGLTDPWTGVASGIPGTSPAILQDPSPSAGSAFYRVAVQP